MNPSYFDVNYRGTIGFDTLPTEATTLLSKPSLPTDILSSVSEIYRPYLPWAYRWYVCPSPGQHLQMHWHLWIRMSMVPTILSMRPSLCLFTRLVQFCWVTIIIYYYYHLYFYICLYYHLYLYMFIYMHIHTSSTAQGGGGSVKDRTL